MSTDPPLGWDAAYCPGTPGWRGQRFGEVALIDTPARQLAALGEARRLLGLVLDRSPQFAQWREACARNAAERAELEAGLASDPRFAAFSYITAAYKLLDQPQSTDADPSARSNPSSIVRLITLLEPRQPPATHVAAMAGTPIADPDREASNLNSEDGGAGGPQPGEGLELLAPPAEVSTSGPAVARIVNDMLVYAPSATPATAVEVVRHPAPAPLSAEDVPPDALPRRFAWLPKRR